VDESLKLTEVCFSLCEQTRYICSRHLNVDYVSFSVLYLQVKEINKHPYYL